MSTLIGILVDVSFSMKNSIGDGVEEEGGTWARSIFKVVNELIKHDVSSSNKTFALAFGGSTSPEVFDLLSTIDQVREEQSSIEDLRSSASKKSMINEALTILERNGAPRVRSWARIDVLLRVIDDTCAAEILYFLKKSHAFTKTFVDDCIPKQCCRVSVEEILVLLVYICVKWDASRIHIEDSVREAIEKGNRLVAKTMKNVKTVSVTKNAIRSVHDASKILLDSIEQFFILNLRSRNSKKQMIEDTLTILENNGAKRVRTWGRMDVLLEVIDDTTAAGILHHLQRSSQFTERFVNECLPRQCREYPESSTGAATEVGFLLATSVSRVCPSSPLQRATEESVREVVKNGKQLIATGYNDRELTDKEFDELLKAMEPRIYWKTPLMQAMRDSVNLFSYPEFANHQKVLFIFSDGQSTDGNNPPLQELYDLGVTMIVICFITDQSLSDPCYLNSIPDESWKEPANFMFRMSSTITTQKMPLTLLVKRGWKIDTNNNETRLFFQVNHPDMIEDVCYLAKNSVLGQDALSSLVDMDLYINQANEGLKAKQHGGTCYANASAAVLHLAMQRTVGRDGGYPDFFELRDRLTTKYGDNGAPTIEVLKDVCPRYRLQCKEVDAVGAMKAISAKRPVVVSFYLTGAQWDQFYQFYEENPKGILTRSYLALKHHSTSDPGGHAVVLTRYDAESLHLMNSWGDNWADEGFFKVQNADVLGLEFVDVF